MLFCCCFYVDIFAFDADYFQDAIYMPLFVGAMRDAAFMRGDMLIDAMSLMLILLICHADIAYALILLPPSLPAALCLRLSEYKDIRLFCFLQLC